MNNKVIAVIVIAIVVLGGGYYLNKNRTESNVAGNSESVGAGAKVEAGTFESLIASGANRKCTYTSNQEGVASEGTIYVAGGKMRGDIAATIQGVSTQTHILHKDNTTYMWDDSGTLAYKMAVDSKDAQADMSSSAAKQAVDFQQNYDFKCEGWTNDSSKFDVPGDIKFSEFPTIPNIPANVEAAASAETGIDSKEAQTLICNSLPTGAKEKCLESLN